MEEQMVDLIQVLLRLLQTEVLVVEVELIVVQLLEELEVAELL
jgi:hypothetical protein